MRKTAKHTKHIKPSNIAQGGYRTSFFNPYPSLQPSGATAFYQFGVFSGWSMVELMNLFVKNNINVTHAYGFDSFQGIPASNEEKLWTPVWAEGEFNSCDYLDVDNPSDACQKIKVFVKENTQSSVIVEMFEGYYCDSLPKVDVSKLIPAFFIDIDVDIYSSAKEALNFMASNNLIVPGTVINYDDWGGSPGHQTFSSGESRAHAEICEQYGISASRIKNNGGQVAYLVEGVG